MGVRGLLAAYSLLALLGCSKPEVEVGTPKDAALQALGRPSAWVRVKRTLGEPSVSVATVYSVASLRNERMEPDVRWILEYTRRDGTKYCLHLEQDRVVAKADGPALKE